MSVTDRVGTTSIINNGSKTTGTSKSSPSSRLHWLWLLRPSLWVALASILAYWDDQALHGEFIYDDDGSIRGNPVVNGQVPWTEVFTRDFWGTPMTDIQSHKSYRPITTLSFKLHWVLFPYQGEGIPGDDKTSGTYSFHVVNVLLHGIVSGLVTEAARYVFSCNNNNNTNNPQDTIAQIVTGFVFGLHPVHAEVVSNVTSRGEVFMSLFFLLAFLSYASQISCGQTPRPGISSFVAIYIFPWLCMFLSLLSKEQGASTLITLVVFDLFHNHFSVMDWLRSIAQRDSRALIFLRRALILGMETVVVCAWRYWLNGETKPDFIFDQNPAGFALDRFTRAFSVTWVYCLYIWDALYPRYLSVDWSGKSIPLVTDLMDIRAMGVIALWTFALVCFVSTIFGVPANSSVAVRYHRTTMLIAFLGFLFVPFLLSSNIFVVVGLMKADRVIYLPLMGFCLMEGLLIRYLCSPAKGMSRHRAWHEPLLAKLAHVVLVVQILLFCRKVHERNLIWGDTVSLWNAAYQVNPISHHTIYNCGYNLSLKGRYKEAEQVLRKIGHPDMDGTTTTFVYAMVLQNLGRCDEAGPLLSRAFEVVEERRQLGGPRNTEDVLRRAESNLLVAKSYCTVDIGERARLLLKSTQVDPTNFYALESANAFNEFIGQQRKLGDPRGIVREIEGRKQRTGK